MNYDGGRYPPTMTPVLSNQVGVGGSHYLHIFTHYLHISTYLLYVLIYVSIYTYLRIYAGAAVVLGARGERAAGDLPAETRGPHAARHQVSCDWRRAIT